PLSLERELFRLVHRRMLRRSTATSRRCARSCSGSRSRGTPGEAEALHAAYETLPKVANNTAAAERDDEVLVVPAEMGWSDVGSEDRLLSRACRARWLPW